MDVRFDLLGDPIPQGKGKPGRDGHIPTAEKAKQIRLLLVAGFTFGGIARELGLSVPTLRKHYFQNGRVKYREARAQAIARERGRNLLMLDDQASKGNVSALKEIRKALDDAALDLADRDAGSPARRKPVADQPAPRPAGKKAANTSAAHDAEAELESLWTGKGLH